LYTCMYITIFLENGYAIRCHIRSIKSYYHKQIKKRDISIQRIEMHRFWWGNSFCSWVSHHSEAYRQRMSTMRTVYNNLKLKCIILSYEVLTNKFTKLKQIKLRWRNSSNSRKQVTHSATSPECTEGLLYYLAQEKKHTIFW